LPPSFQLAGYSPQAFTLPLALCGIAVGALFVYLTPDYASSLEWLNAFLNYHLSASEFDHEEAATQTGIRRVHTEGGAIERSDGAYVGLVKVTPPTMALATDAEWTRKAKAFEDFCNTTLSFPIQIFSTTEPFVVEQYLEHYESRLTDADVQDNPRLESLIEEYAAWYESDLEERQMTIRDHYIVVSVTPPEVQFDHDSLLGQFASIPLLGLLIRARLAPPQETRHEALADELHDRLGRVESGMRGIEDCQASRVDVEDGARVMARYWGAEPSDERFDDAPDIQ
jgi:hypothetical protein